MRVCVCTCMCVTTIYQSYYHRNKFFSFEEQNVLWAKPSGFILVKENEQIPANGELRGTPRIFQDNLQIMFAQTELTVSCHKN